MRPVAVAQKHRVVESSSQQHVHHAGRRRSTVALVLVLVTHRQNVDPPATHVGRLKGKVNGVQQFARRLVNQSINQSCIFRVVQVTKSPQDPLEVGNNLAGISDNVRESLRDSRAIWDHRVSSATRQR